MNISIVARCLLRLLRKEDDLASFYISKRKVLLVYYLIHLLLVHIIQVHLLPAVRKPPTVKVCVTGFDGVKFQTTGEMALKQPSRHKLLTSAAQNLLTQPPVPE